MEVKDNTYILESLGYWVSSFTVVDCFIYKTGYEFRFNKEILN